MQMRSALYGPDGGIVIFVGVQEGIRVVLFGSRHHLIGSWSPENSSSGFSNDLSLYQLAYKEEPISGLSSRSRRAVVDMVQALTDDVQGIDQEREFLARRVLSGKWRILDFDEEPYDNAAKILVGAPLFVSLDG
jgi:hypothetical protein